MQQIFIQEPKQGALLMPREGVVGEALLGEMLVLQPLSPALVWSPTRGDKCWGSPHSPVAPGQGLLQEQDELLLGGLGAGGQLGWEKEGHSSSQK